MLLACRAPTYAAKKSAMSSQRDRFGILPMTTFFTFRLSPTGATVTAKWRMSIRSVVGLYEINTQR